MNVKESMKKTEAKTVSTSTSQQEDAALFVKNKVYTYVKASHESSYV